MFYIENKKEEALAFTQQRKLDLVNNHLHAYMAANLAINNKQSEYAKKVILNRNLSDEYLKVSIWDFVLGFTKLYHLETQDAAKYLEIFLSSFKGKFYVKDAYQKLSWCYYLQGNMPAAEETRKKIIQKGATSVTHTRKENRGTEVYSDKKRYITYHTCLNECNDQFNRKIFTQ